jgi:hypothetical protein
MLLGYSAKSTPMNLLYLAQEYVHDREPIVIFITGSFKR